MLKSIWALATLTESESYDSVVRFTASLFIMPLSKLFSHHVLISPVLIASKAMWNPNGAERTVRRVDAVQNRAGLKSCETENKPREVISLKRNRSDPFGKRVSQLPWLSSPTLHETEGNKTERNFMLKVGSGNVICGAQSSCRCLA